MWISDRDSVSFMYKWVFSHEEILGFLIFSAFFLIFPHFCPFLANFRNFFFGHFFRTMVSQNPHDRIFFTLGGLPLISDAEHFVLKTSYKIRTFIMGSRK
jgi:hypothetical protein